MDSCAEQILDVLPATRPQIVKTLGISAVTVGKWITHFLKTEEVYVSGYAPRNAAEGKEPKAEVKGTAFVEILSLGPPPPGFVPPVRPMRQKDLRQLNTQEREQRLQAEAERLAEESLTSDDREDGKPVIIRAIAVPTGIKRHPDFLMRAMYPETMRMQSYA